MLCRHCGDKIGKAVCAVCRCALTEFAECGECHADRAHGAVGPPPEAKEGHSDPTVASMLNYEGEYRE